jgi:nicotinamidase-related amidase
MKKALIVIDFVVDFVAADGKLSCGKPAEDIDGYIAAKVKEFARNGDFVVVASDCHTADDTFSPEHKLFPPHCISGTPGCASFGQTGEALKAVPPAQSIKIDKLRYSAFAATCLDLKLRERDVSDVYLAGVCSDICVLHTAVDAYNLGYTLHVYEKGTASFNPEGHAFALQHFKHTLGAEIL